MPNRPIKFGCHDFLNSRPITWAITGKLVDTPFETVFAPPSALSDMLARGELDMAIIPTVEYARIPGLRISPEIAIAAEGDVETVILFSKGDPWKAESVAADSRSRTSIALLKILFRRIAQRDVEVVPNNGTDPEALLRHGKAGLIIGDEAFGIDGSRYMKADLSGEWNRLTGKPFVFAILCVREGVEAAAAVDALVKCREEGLKRIGDICDSFSSAGNISWDTCRRYLTDIIRYTAGERERDGMELFLRMAGDAGLAEKGVEVRYL